ncbi:serine hydrolase [Ideonella sp. BN130291]|uniref:serine hydrolase n=1 Tax=Ideonella sp. BN130291 TaxID=3112940 RepID=UPI002E2678EC|nr:serine hydrolase [Ideonella sp. BN130291]
MHRLAAIALVSLLFMGSAQAASWSDLRLGSAHAIVVDEATGEVLLEKDGSTAAPIASLTKLMTAMVVLDAQQDPNEGLRISEADIDTLKHTRSGVRVGTVLSRAALLELALIASDNHAASALARHYPGGMDAFLAAVQQKIQTLGLASTLIEEPTGLSPHNRSSALDMVKVVRAAGGYPVITDITSKRRHAVMVNGHVWAVKNTNSLVGSPGWNILTSKTGFTNEAGRCLSMRLQAAGRTVAVVLMGAMGSSERALDALNIRRWLAGEPPVTAVAAAPKGQRRQAAAQRKHAGVVQASVAADAGTHLVIERTAPSITIRESTADLGE